MYNLFLMES